MMKKVLISIVLLLVAAYLVVATTIFNVKPAGQVCDDIELIIKDSVNAGFITKQEVAGILKSKKAYPVGTGVDSVDTRKIEDILAVHPLIDEVECYKTPNGKLHVEVSQRIPVIRVMSRNGANYYIDNKGEVMPPESRCIAHLVVVTGKIDTAYARKELYDFGLFLQKNKFWNSQIEQLNITSWNEVEVVPRVGDHIVFLGKIDNYENKLERLKEFYRKGLNKVGWNKYNRINMEFNNQIICTRK